MEPSAHQPALFLIHSGTGSEDVSPDLAMSGIIRIFCFIKNSIVFRNSVWEIESSAHQPALVLKYHKKYQINLRQVRELVKYYYALSREIVF